MINLPTAGRGYVFTVDSTNPFSGVQSFALYRSVSVAPNSAESLNLRYKKNFVYVKSFPDNY